MKKLLSILIVLILAQGVICSSGAETSCVYCGDTGAFLCPESGKNNFEIDCLNCSWTGSYRYTCRNCNGTGRPFCLRCMGSGEVTCTKCRGSGVTKCTNCNGTGETGIDPCLICWMKGTKSCPLKEPCSNCSEEKCRTCKGARYIQGYSCGASATSANHQVVCKTCRSTDHRYVCPFCSGTECEAFVYNKVMREPESYVGKTFSVTGTVMSIHQSGSRVCTISLRSQEGEFYRYYDIQYIMQETSLRLLQGDQVTMYGPMISYTTDNVPLMNAYYAELLE